jgi:hypothetical protein
MGTCYALVINKSSNIDVNADGNGVRLWGGSYQVVLLRGVYSKQNRVNTLPKGKTKFKGKLDRDEYNVTMIELCFLYL